MKNRVLGALPDPFCWTNESRSPGTDLFYPRSTGNSDDYSHESAWCPEEQDLCPCESFQPNTLSYLILWAGFLMWTGSCLSPAAGEGAIFCISFRDTCVNDDGLHLGGNFISWHYKENNRPAKLNLLAEKEKEWRGYYLLTMKRGPHSTTLSFEFPMIAES